MLLIIILSLYQRDIAEYHNYSHSSYFHTGLDCIFHLRGRPYSRWTFSLTFLYCIPYHHHIGRRKEKRKTFYRAWLRITQSNTDYYHTQVLYSWCYGTTFIVYNGTG